MRTEQRRWILGGLLLASGVGLMAAASRKNLIRPDTRLLLVGDSLAVGLAPHLELLAEEEGIEDYRALAVSGSRIDQWADSAALEEVLETFHPTLVLVSLGTNDEALGPGAADRQAEALDELLALFEDTDAAIAWIGPPELPFEGGGVRELLMEAVPHYFDSEDYEIPRGPDDLHPTAAGYAGWAGVIWTWLT